MVGDDERLLMLDTAVNAPHNETFCAVLEPNPPLSSKATWIIMSALTIFCCVVGFVFLMVGAWPVTGFMGLELLAFGIAFSICRSRARVRERVAVDHRGMLIERNDPKLGHQAWQFEGHWARASAEREGSRRSCLVVRERGIGHRFGRFLNHDENVSLANAINQALQKYRVSV